MTDYTYDMLNISLSSTSLAILLGALYLGIVLACIYSALDKYVSNEIVRSLTTLEASSPDTALTLCEMPIKRKKLALYFLRKSSRFRKTIICANANEFIVENKPSKFKETLYKIFSIAKEDKEVLVLEKARFYLPPENKIHTEVTMTTKGKSNLLIVIISRQQSP